MGDGFARLRATLIRHEGMKLKPYFCPGGKLTIGVGRNIEDVGITESEAMIMLGNDITRIVMEARSNFPWYAELNDARQDVVLSMIFNLGLHGFMDFKKTIQAIACRDYDLASREMMDSLWASQVGKRAYELSRMMALGEYVES